MITFGEEFFGERCVIGCSVTDYYMQDLARGMRLAAGSMLIFGKMMLPRDEMMLRRDQTMRTLGEMMRSDDERMRQVGETTLPRAETMLFDRQLHAETPTR